MEGFAGTRGPVYPARPAANQCAIVAVAGTVGDGAASSVIELVMCHEPSRRRPKAQV